MFAIFPWLAHWHSPTTAFSSPYGAERTISSYRLQLLTKIDGHNFKSKHIIVYPSIPSAPRPVEHGNSLPNPKPPQQWTLHEEPNSTSPEDEPGPSCSNVDSDFPELTVPYLISLSELNDHVTDLNLSKIQAELVTSLSYLLLHGAESFLRT